MKNVVLLFIVGWLGASCASQQARVDAMHSVLSGSSLNQTYAILQSGDFRTLTAPQQEVVQQEIDTQMQARGYRKVERNPDLAIVFSLYGQPCTWRASKLVRQHRPFSARKGQNSGTLVIQMVDENLNRSVWLGYATGLLPGQHVALEDRQLKAVTRQILDEYREMAPGYVVRDR